MSEKRQIPFNLNEYVRVRLNERGVKILREKHDRLVERWKDIPAFKLPAVDDDGWSRFQGWEFMQVFGPHMRLGDIPPFELGIEFEVTDDRAKALGEQNTKTDGESA